MYRELYTQIRVTDDYLNNKYLDALKKDMLTDKYCIFSAETKRMVPHVTEFSNLLTFFGITIFNVEKDEYHWSNIKVNANDLKILSNLFKDYKECFVNTTQIKLIKSGTYKTYTYSFKDFCFIEEVLPYAKIYMHPDKYTVLKDEEKFFQKKNNEEYLEETNAVDIFSLLNDPWSEDAISYTINTKYGLFICAYNVIVYDGVEATIFGYGNTEINSLFNCKNNFEKLKTRAFDDGYEEN